jgi:peptidoglycan/xylan/chitin deacetylase (PgdA/CDA1 family)
MTARIVTTSWDDGELTDLKLAEMLRARGIAGTFYVPVNPHQGRPQLSHSDLRDLSAEGFEIGAHTVSHKHLWGLSPEELSAEIDPCKPILENITGSEVRMFCYPRGRYDRNVIRSLKKAGYWGARTVAMLSTNPEFDAFEMPTSLQVSPTTRISYLKNIARARSVPAMAVYISKFTALGCWVELGKRLFDSVLAHGGLWHIYGHSQEIEELGLWTQLQEMLDYIARRENVKYVTNSCLIRPLPLQGSLAGSSHL